VSKNHISIALAVILLAFSVPRVGNCQSDSSAIKTLSVETKQYNSTVYPGVTYQKIQRPTIGLALSGGGLKGIAHVGVLKALTENNIPIDYITGTSSGSIIGGLYALGYTIEEIDSIARAIDYETLFIDQTQRRNLFISQKEQASKYLVDVRFDSLKPYIPISITPGQGIGRELRNVYMHSPLNTVRDFDNYPVIFRSVATDLETGDRVVIRQGDWVEAIQASMAIPMVMSPVIRKGRRLIDGGVADNIPINLAKNIGADMVVAVDVRAKLYEPKELKNLLTVADQVINILMNTSREEALDNAAVVVSPDFDEELTEFENQAAEYIVRGYRAGLQKAKEIKKTYADMVISDSTAYHVDTVKISGNATLSDAHLREIIRYSRLKDRKVIHGSRIDSSLQYLIRSGYFADAVAEIKQQRDTTSLEFRVQERPVVNRTTISGVTLVADSIFARHFATMEGYPYNPRMLETLITRLIRKYRKRGYPLAQVDTVVWKPTSGIVTVHIAEGKVAQISVSGNTVSRDFVITREVNIDPGDFVNVKDVTRSITNIYSTGLYDYATVNFVSTSDTSGWNLVFNVVEKKYLSIRFGYKVNNQRGNAGLLTLAHQNFRGRGVKVSTEIKMGTEEAYIHGHYSSNRFFQTYITYDFALGYERDWYRIYTPENQFETRNFTLERNFVSYSLGHQIARLGLVNFTGKAQRVILDGPESQEKYNTDRMLVSLSAQSVIDTKDRTVFARTGNYQKIAYEAASKDLAGDVGYTRFQLLTEWYFTFLNRNTIHPRIHIGIMDQSVQFSEWFQLGGINSFFGLQESHIWSPKIYQGSLEYRYRLPVSSLFDINFYLRYDIAAYSEEVIHKISNSDFINGHGIGMGVTTPAGPLHLGYGKSSTGDNAFYFYFGWEF